MEKEKIMSFVKKYTMIIVLVLVMIFFGIGTGGKLFLPQNVTNLISQNAYVFVLATGMLLCILTGGNIDLSIGSVVCFTGAVGATMMDKGINSVAAVFAMLVVGLIIGSIQAVCIAYIHVPPFITTLAGMLAFRGLSNVVLNGMTVSVTDEAFQKIFGGGANCYVPDLFGMEGFNLTCMLLGIIACVIYVVIQINGRVSRVKKGYEVDSLTGMIIKTVVICAVICVLAFKLSQYKGIPTVLIWVLLVVLIYGYITSKTTIGRYFYAVGGNEKATKLSGINTNRVYFLAYANMGLLAGLAGILTIARLTSAQPTYGQNYEMDAIGSCFIGGASAYGGTGTVPGVIVGAVLMGIINLGMSIMGVDSNWQRVIKGIVLLLAVIFDVTTKKEGK